MNTMFGPFMRSGFLLLLALLLFLGTPARSSAGTTASGPLTLSVGMVAATPSLAMVDPLRRWPSWGRVTLYLVILVGLPLALFSAVYGTLTHGQWLFPLLSFLAVYGGCFIWQAAATPVLSQGLARAVMSGHLDQVIQVLDGGLSNMAHDRALWLVLGATAGLIIPARARLEENKRKRANTIRPDRPQISAPNDFPEINPQRQRVRVRNQFGGTEEPQAFAFDYPFIRVNDTVFDLSKSSHRGQLFQLDTGTTIEFEDKVSASVFSR